MNRIADDWRLTGIFSCILLIALGVGLLMLHAGHLYDLCGFVGILLACALSLYWIFSVAQEASLKREQEEIEHTSDIDPLTGLANHRTIIYRLGSEIRRAARYQRNLSLIYADLDHFKSINETCGHNTADDVLSIIARCLQSGTRESDLVARYSGEEFIILLPETPLLMAGLLANRLRQAIQETPLPTVATEQSMTISCGVAAFPETANSLEDLLSSAEHAMNEAKRRGRNCVYMASHPDLNTDANASEQLPDVES